jgi:hypothetical protein
MTLETVRRIGLVGCVKDKAQVALPARDLYRSTLFAGRRRFVGRTCDDWWILSAEHGLVHPDDVLEPHPGTRVAVLDRDGDRVQVFTLSGRCYGSFVEAES